MSSTRMSKALLDLVVKLLHYPRELTSSQQRVFLSALAHTQKFNEPLKSGLLTLAEVAGDDDETLPEKLRKYLEWRRAAQEEADSPPPDEPE